MMSDYGRIDAAELDNYITGHYGEDQFRDDEEESPPGVKNGVIVDASYWLWVDEQRAPPHRRRGPKQNEEPKS